MKNKDIYTNEELELLKALENNLETHKPMPKKELQNAKDYYQQIAENTIKKMTKKRAINLRVYENDIPSIKALALEKGLPYQTLLTSIIHQVATGKLKV